jgi:hypothetical protein
MPDADVLFEARTPLGFTVRVTKARWELIMAIKHPVMAGREAGVKLALESPDEIRQSRSDSQALLFYKEQANRRWVCAVVKQGVRKVPDHGVPDGRVNEGTRKWPK